MEKSTECFQDILCNVIPRTVEVHFASIESKYIDHVFGLKNKKFTVVIKTKPLSCFALDSVSSQLGGLTREYQNKTKEFCQAIEASRLNRVVIEAGIDHCAVNWDYDQDRLSLRISSESLKSLMCFVKNINHGTTFWFDNEILAHIVSKLEDSSFDIYSSEMEYK